VPIYNRSGISNVYFDMKSLFTSLNRTQPTPLVSLFAVITSLLVGILIYQKFFGSEYFDFGPIMIWIAVAVPAGLFGAVFLQSRANARARRIESKISQLEAESRRINDPRHAPQPDLDRPLPEKDPFENM
jgi:hypothetical protein